MNRLLVCLISLFLLAGIALAQPDTLWTRSYGTYYRSAQLVEPTSDGGYLVITIGWYAYRFNNSGDSLWSIHIGDLAYRPESILRLEDNTFVIAGYNYTSSEEPAPAYLVKIDEEANIIWQRNFFGLGHATFRGLSRTADGGFLATGTSSDLGDGRSKIFVVKTNSNGDSLWTSVIGEADSAYNGYSAVELESGEVAFSGKAQWSFDPSHGFPIVGKLDNTGNLLQFDILDYMGTFRPSKLIAIDDGGFAMGITLDAGYHYFKILRYTSNGDTLWSQVYREGSMLYDFIQTSDGGFLLAGDAIDVRPPLNNNFAILVKTNPEGVKEWFKYYGIPSGCDWIESFTAVREMPDHSYIAAGAFCEDYYRELDCIFLIRTLPDQTLDAEQKPVQIPQDISVSSFPNPFNPNTTISFILPQSQQVKLAVYDVLGREVKVLVNEKKNAGEHHIQFNGANLPSGIYLARLELSSGQIGGSASAKIVKMVMLK